MVIQNEILPHEDSRGRGIFSTVYDRLGITKGWYEEQENIVHKNHSAETMSEGQVVIEGFGLTA